MDFDPTLYSAPDDHADEPAQPASAFSGATPFDSRIALPAEPRPSLSPSASRVFDRKQADKAPRYGAGLDLSAPVSPRSRSARSANMTLPSGETSQAPGTDDSRDTASIRQNIQNLINAGTSSGTANSTSTPSLAQLMGASGQKRTHRINTGMTEQEREETEKLEREMAAARAKWAGKSGATANDPSETNGPLRGGGMSLASLLTGKPTTRAATAPAALAVSEEAQEPVTTRQQVRSPQPESPVVERKPRQTGPPVDVASQPSSQPEREREPPAPAPRPSPPADFAPTKSSEDAPASPRKPTDTLKRLNSSNIVADRLRWSEQIQQGSGNSNSPSPSASLPPSPEKRRSVLERWGRDEPNSSTAGATPASPTAVRTRPKSIFDAPAPSTPSFEQMDKPRPEQKSEVEESTPKLQHVTRDRARPTKSTARSGSTLSLPVAADNLEEAKDAVTSPSGSSISSSKPTWQGAPIGAKPSSPLPAEVVTDESNQPAPRHTRGVALPGMSLPSTDKMARSPSPFSSTAPAAQAVPAQPTPPASPSKSSGSGVSSVRAAAMRWGQQQDAEAEEKRETLAALKASYGVKVGPVPTPARQATLPSPAAKQEESVAPPQKSKSVDVQLLPAATPAQTEPPQAKEAAPSSPPATKSRPDLSLTTSDTQVEQPVQASSDILSLVTSQIEPYHLPPGETLSLDVFHLNSDNPDPIDHNHVLHTTEILGIVHRAEDSKTGGVRTHVWVWRGDEAKDTKRTDERIIRLEDKTGVEAVEIAYRHEPPALAEAFAGQLTICRGPRDKFDHLARRMFSVQLHDDVVYVEEVPVTSRSLCSGYSTIFSALGEVYAWLGEGSNEAEKHACCEFAEALADGRAVTVLAEGQETAMFWHNLPDEAEYASAQYWRRRALYPNQRTTVVRVDSGAKQSFSIVPDGAVPRDAVSVIDGGHAELWVVIPTICRSRKDDVRTALGAIEALSQAWKKRDFASRTPYHVITFPSLIPRDLPFLSRSLELDALNTGAPPSKMHVYTAKEARKELL